MQIKSWQIALGGTIIQILWLTIIMSLLKKEGQGDIAFAAGMGILFGLVYLIIGIISILFLYFNKTQKIGAMVSIFLGAGSILFFTDRIDSRLDETSISIIIQGIFVVFAGLYYFWKKV